MAEDESFCLSFEEDVVSVSPKNRKEKPIFHSEVDTTPNTIRLDALKLSKQLKYKNFSHNNALSIPTEKVCYSILKYYE